MSRILVLRPQVDIENDPDVVVFIDCDIGVKSAQSLADVGGLFDQGATDEENDLLFIQVQLGPAIDDLESEPVLTVWPVGLDRQERLTLILRPVRRVVDVERRRSAPWAVPKVLSDLGASDRSVAVIAEPHV